MKTKLFFIFTLSVLITSCYSSKSIIDDDVYVLKNSSLPVGESLTDETSYATYLYRQHHEIESNDSYYYDRNSLDYSNSYYPTYWGGSCYCNPGFLGYPQVMNPWYGNGCYGNGYYGNNYYGNGYYGNGYYGNSYYGNGYYGNGYYGNNYYGNGYYGNGYYGNGYYGNNYYGNGYYGGWKNPYSNSATSGTFYNSSNHHVGARGSYAGASQSPSRSNPYMLKSSTAPLNTGRSASYSPYSMNRTVSRQGANGSSASSRPTRNSQGSVYRPTTSRPATPSSNEREVNPTRGTYNVSRSGGGGNNNRGVEQRTPSQPNRGGGTTTSPSRGGGNGGGSSPSPSRGGGSGGNGGTRRN